MNSREKTNQFYRNLLIMYANFNKRVYNQNNINSKLLPIEKLLKSEHFIALPSLQHLINFKILMSLTHFLPSTRIFIKNWYLIIIIGYYYYYDCN